MMSDREGIAREAWTKIKSAGIQCHLDPDSDVLVLCEYAMRLKPSDVYLEIGTWMGGSAAIVALVTPPTVAVHTIDSASFHEARWRHTAAEYRNILQGNFMRCGVRDRISISLLGSIDTSWEKEIDLLFIDGEHGHAPVSADAAKWLPLVAEGGVALFHDYFLYSGVKRVVDGILEEGSWERLPGGDNLVAITRAIPVERLSDD